MAIATASARSRQNGPFPLAVGGRGVPQTVRRTTLVAAVVEGQAFADEVMRHSADLQTLGASGSRQQIVHAAGRLGHLAQTYRDEFRRLAGEAEL